MRKSPATSPYTPKPFIFPENMICVVDSREQKSIFGSRPPKGLHIVTDTLHDGDYSIRGLEHLFCIERKGISDLISYCTTEVKRTKVKMQRFREMEWVGLIIEAKESEIYSPYYFSKVSPEAIRQSIVSFEIRFGVHVYINGDREMLMRWMLDRMVKFHKMIHEV